MPLSMVTYNERVGRILPSLSHMQPWSIISSGFIFEVGNSHQVSQTEMCHRSIILIIQIHDGRLWWHRRTEIWLMLYFQLWSLNHLTKDSKHIMVAVQQWGRTGHFSRKILQDIGGSTIREIKRNPTIIFFNVVYVSGTQLQNLLFFLEPVTSQTVCPSHFCTPGKPAPRLFWGDFLALVD